MQYRRKWRRWALGMGAAWAVAGCGGTNSASPPSSPSQPATDAWVFVMNNKSDTISVINPVSNQVVKTIDAKGITMAPYPSNKWATGSGYVLSGWRRSLSILKVSGEDISVVKNLTLPPSVTSQNGKHLPQTGVWADITPDGLLGVVAVREAEKMLFIDMNPKDSAFGTVVDTVDTSHLGPHGTGIGP